MCLQDQNCAEKKSQQQEMLQLLGIYDAAAFKTRTGRGIVLIESKSQMLYQERPGSAWKSKRRDGEHWKSNLGERKNERYDPVCGMGCPGN